MIAVIKTGGKQYRVSPGDKIKVEKLDKKEGDNIYFDSVLLFEDKGNIEIGKPIIKGMKVKGKVLSEEKGKKVLIFKYKPKKRYKVKKGHRQIHTEVEVLEIKKDK